MNVFSNQKVPNCKIAYYYFSGGTTGKPKVIPFTSSEWEKRSAYRAMCYRKIGLNKHNKIALLLPFGPWVAGPSVQNAMKHLECTYFPIGILKEVEEFIGFIEIIDTHNIDTIISMPSAIERFMDVYESSKNTINLNLKYIITSGEYLTQNVRKRVRKLFNTKCFSSYASSELFIGVECEKNIGCYHYDNNILDIYEKSGELYFTHKISEVIKLEKYSLGDFGKIYTNTCSCGIDLPRVCITGRKSGIFVIAGGVNVTSEQISEVIKKTKLKINKCLIDILTHAPGIDRINFTFYLQDVNLNNRENLIKYIGKIFKNISIDFSDAVSCGQVIFAINLINTKYRHYSKLKIKINDNRKYER